MLHADGKSVLHDAVVEDQKDLVLQLIKHKANIDQLDMNQGMFRHGKTPIHLAIFYNKLDILQLLLESKADVNRPQADGKTPLMLAAMLGNTAALTLLLNQEKIEVDQENMTEHFPRDEYMSALKYAGRYRHLESIKTLIYHGAKINDFLDYVHANIKQETVNYLKEFKAKPVWL